MAEPTLYREAEPWTAGAVATWVVPVELQECRLVSSEPHWHGDRGGVMDGYRIILMSDKPADSLTMHGELWLVPGAGIGDNDE